MARPLLLLCVCLLAAAAAADTLQTVEDAEFDKLVREEKYVVALLCTEANAERCEEFEGELASIREDLIESLEDGWVVKLVDSDLWQLFAFSNEKPIIVFLRSGVPVLYDGPANEEVLLAQLLQAREPAVQDLTDSTFEHLTQASTGATTGDWFVLFYTDECQACRRLQAGLDTLACGLKGRANVARVNKETYGEKTGRRFGLGLDSTPALIYFRHGKMYRYTLAKFDPESMNSFVLGFYKNYPAESIPLPMSPFDDLVQLCVDYLKQYPLLVGGSLALPVLLLLAFLWLMKGEEEKPRRSGKKERKNREKEANGTAKDSKSPKSTPKTPKTKKEDGKERKEDGKEEGSKEKKDGSKEKKGDGKEKKKDKESSKNK